MHPLEKIYITEFNYPFYLNYALAYIRLQLHPSDLQTPRKRTLASLGI